MPAVPPDMPPEVTRAADAHGLPRFPTWGDPELRPVDFAETYARLVALTAARCEFLGTLLERQLAAEGVGGLVGIEYDVVEVREGRDVTYERVPSGKESIRALVALEAQERERLAKYIRDGARLGIEARQADALRRVGTWVSTSLRSLVAELGLDWDDDSVRRASRRAVLASRSALGAEGGVGADPSSAGPPLTIDERMRVLGQGPR